MMIKRVIEIEEKDLERIREIVERENKTALSVTTRGTAYLTIADSKPYEERPRGEWKETGYETGALGITYRQTQCSNCGWEHALPMWWHFCPNCGADMRRGSDAK